MKAKTDNYTQKRDALRSFVSFWRLPMIAASLAMPFSAAHAYVGPGLGLGTLVVILGVIGSALLAIFGVVWYPIKRMLKKRKADRSQDERREDNDPISTDDREPAEP